MKIMTFAIQKGGTGKTSAAVIPAVSLAEKGKKTLLLDADPLVYTTAWVLGETAIAHDLADVLLKRCIAKDAITTSPKMNGYPLFPENLFLIPTASLGSPLRLYSKTAANQAPFAIRQLLKTVRNDFDFAIIDTSPAFGGLEESCLLASDEVIAVLNIDEFSHDGLVTFINNMADMRALYDTEKPVLNKLVLNARDKRLVQQKDYIESIERAAKAHFV